MFAAQQRQLGRGQLCAHKSYQLADLWGGGNPGSPLMRKGAKDAAIFQDLDAGLKSRVFVAGKNSANGKSTPEDAPSKTRSRRCSRRGNWSLPWLRRCFEFATRLQTLRPDLACSPRHYQPAPTARQTHPLDIHDPFGPAGGGYKSAGDARFLSLLKNYLDAHGIGRRSCPARVPAMDLLKGRLASREIAQLNASPAGLVEDILDRALGHLARVPCASRSGSAPAAAGAAYCVRWRRVRPAKAGKPGPASCHRTAGARRKV